MRLSSMAARRGDCFWLEWTHRGRVRRLVVDGGTPPVAGRLRARIAALPADDRRIELFVVSHVDIDHIGGSLAVLERGVPGLVVGDVWFNGRRHLPGARGPSEGEQLGNVLDDVGARYPWNAAVGGGPIVVDDVDRPPVVELDGGLRLTVLSPVPSGLARLAPVWDEAVTRARSGEPSPEEPQPIARAGGGRRRSVEDLAAVRSRPDKAPANGSSIAILAEQAGRSVLLAADAHPDVLTASVRALARSRGEERLPVDVVTLPHHGSQANVSVELVQALRCRRWVFSSNGEMFGHPDPAAVARVLLHGGPDPTLVFNYRSPSTSRWDNPRLMGRHGFTVVYPAARGAGVSVEV